MTSQILITDDDDATRHLYRDILRWRGFGVVEAATGEECIERARELRPSLIILDLQMPVRDGFSTARSLRACADTCSIPILAVTGISRSADIEKALQAGCDAVLNKPLSPADLLKGVQALLEHYEGEGIRRDAEQQREAAAALVQRSYEDLRALRIPGDEVTETQLRQWMQGAHVSVCSFCGRGRLATGEWRPITRELHDFLERWTTLSHGICPECLAREYPGSARQDDTS